MMRLSGVLSRQAGAELDLVLQDHPHPPAGLRNVHPLGQIALRPEAVQVADHGAALRPRSSVAALKLSSSSMTSNGMITSLSANQEYRVGVVQEDVGINDEVLGFVVH